MRAAIGRRAGDRGAVRVWAAVAALALVAAGCSGSGGDGEDAEKVGTVARLDALTAGTTKGTARIDLTVEFAGSAAENDLLGGAAYEASGSVLVDFDHDRSSTSFTMTLSAPTVAGAVDEGPTSWTVHGEERTIGDASWDRQWLDGDEPGPWSDWSAADKFESVGEDIGGAGSDEVGPEPGSDTGPGPEPTDDPDTPPGDERYDGDVGGMLDDPTSFDPGRFFELLSATALSVREVGPDTVRGDATTRYSAELPAGTLVFSEPDDQPDHLDVWVDEHERVRRVVGEGFTVELYDFGVEVEVEAPTDVTDEMSEPFAPELTGPWVEEASGTTGGAAWRVFAAPAEIGGHPTACRTFEVEGASTGEDGFAGLPSGGVVHDGVPATCGASGLSLAPVNLRPAVTVLVSDLFSWGGDDAGRAVPVAFVVAADHPSATVELVPVDGEPVRVPVAPSGVAVWAVAAVGPIAAVRIDGGIECRTAMGAFPGEETGWDDEGVTEPDASEGQDALDGQDEGEPLEIRALTSLSMGLAPCVRT